MKKEQEITKVGDTRSVERHELVHDLSVVYEGASTPAPVHQPDLSTRGMFLSTPQAFAVGSVLKVNFRLPHSNAEVNVRAEVRHCIWGSGVGVEFLDLAQEAHDAIARELGISEPEANDPKQELQEVVS